DSTTVTIKAGDYITPGLVPNVVGMGAQDALYLLESVGLKVKINGVGRVRQQSLRAGTRFNSGSTIVLTLRM
ncbi:MAG: PASTA domain-containing protein, partial [Bacteroidaceae bacterium]|nr:PASTA domain-containing protein [Bacteroidaceae bacterium]